MFESDGDWDVDQDFLDDIDDKATQYYSQSECTAEHESGKKRKIDTGDCSTTQTNTKQDGPCSGDASKTSRTDLVLGLFGKTFSKNPKVTVDNNASSPQLPNKDISKPDCSQAKDKPSDNATRKDLVLGILTNRNVPASQKTDSSLKLSNEASKIGGKSCNKVQPKVQDTRCSNVKNVSEKIATSMESKTHAAKGSDSLRKQMVLDILKQYPARKKPEKTIVKKSPPVIKIPQASEKVTLIRKFPGPAGLLPDKLEGFIPPVSYWNSIEESENKGPPESNLSEFCSQHTKNLFTEGAWQHMLDDLPSGFLKGYDIASIKHKANINHNRSTKVQFLAGIIECIDHSHENPPIVIKDFTDSIQGIIHHDIPTKYPGLLEPNVVVLLHDVGLLRMSGTLFSSKYNVLISPSSLLGIYTSKGDIVHTPRMKAKFGDDLNSNRENTKNLKSASLISKPNLNKLLTNKNATDTKNTDSILSQETLELVNDSICFDDADDFSFCVSPTEITNTQNQKNFAKSVSSPISASSGVKKTEAPLNSLKKKLSSVVKCEKQIPSTKKLGSGVQCSTSVKNFTGKTISVSDFDLTEVDLNDSIKDPTEKSDSRIAEKVKSDTAKPKSTVRSKLFKFRSNDVLTPAEVKDVDALNPQTISSTLNNTQELADGKTLSVGSNLFQSMLCGSGNDSDDEILSQLDVDTIFSNYDKSK